MGFWHTGYIEHHSLNDLEGLTNPPPVVEHICESCNLNFPSIHLLHKHIFENHPSHQPILCIGDISLGRSELVITKKIAENQINISENTSKITIDNREVTRSELVKILAESDKESYQIKLFENRNISEFRLKFSIPEQSQIEEIDVYLVKMSHKRVLNTVQINRFIDFFEKFRQYPSFDYVDAISTYFFAALNYEKNLNIIDVIEKYRKVNHILSRYNTKIANTIVGIIRFFDGGEKNLHYCASKLEKTSIGWISKNLLGSRSEIDYSWLSIPDSSLLASNDNLLVNMFSDSFTSETMEYFLTPFEDLHKIITEQKVEEIIQGNRFNKNNWIDFLANYALYSNNIVLAKKLQPQLRRLNSNLLNTRICTLLEQQTK